MSAAVYFFIVFFFGFIFGVLRTLLLEPIIGLNYAELVEIPLMLIVIYFTSVLVLNRFNIQYFFKIRLGIGMLALLFMLLAEFTLVIFISNSSILEYLNSKNNFSGYVYLISLLLFALMPLFVEKEK